MIKSNDVQTSPTHFTVHMYNTAHALPFHSADRFSVAGRSVLKAIGAADFTNLNSICLLNYEKYDISTN